MTHPDGQDNESTDHSMVIRREIPWAKFKSGNSHSGLAFRLLHTQRREYRRKHTRRDPNRPDATILFSKGCLNFAQWPDNAYHDKPYTPDRTMSISNLYENVSTKESEERGGSMYHHR